MTPSNRTICQPSPFFKIIFFSQHHFLANTSYTFAIPLDFLPSWHSLLLEYFDIAVWHYTLVHKHADKTRKNASSSPQATCHSLPYLIRHLLEYNIYIYKIFTFFFLGKTNSVQPDASAYLVDWWLLSFCQKSPGRLLSKHHWVLIKVHFSSHLLTLSKVHRCACETLGISRSYERLQIFVAFLS